MAPSYKQQISELNARLSNQTITIDRLVEERNIAGACVTAIYKASTKCADMMSQWERSTASDIMDITEPLMISPPNQLNFPLLADLVIQVMSASMRALCRSEILLSEVEHELAGAPDVKEVDWSTHASEIPSPLVRTMQLLDKALSEVRGESEKGKRSSLEALTTDFDRIAQESQDVLSELRADSMSPEVGADHLNDKEGGEMRVKPSPKEKKKKTSNTAARTGVRRHSSNQG